MKVIGNLEESLAQVQETFSQREAALLRDRDQAALSARYITLLASINPLIPSINPR